MRRRLEREQSGGVMAPSEVVKSLSLLVCRDLTHDHS